MANSLEKYRKKYHFREFSGDDHNLLKYPRVSHEIAAWFRSHYKRPLAQQGRNRNDRLPDADARMTMDAHWRRPPISPIR
jgi:hypothetical protein